MENIQAFFDACEQGKGWEVCKQYCLEDAAFECDVLPPQNLQAYTEWMKGLVAGPMPDAKYEVMSKTQGEGHSVYCAKFLATHTGEGGPVAASDPPKKTACDYVYIIWYNGEHKVTRMRKIWDQLTAFKQLGWPIPA